MKKKHRDIVVDDVTYGWMVEWTCGEHHVRIWRDKKVIAKYNIASHHDSVTPGIIAALIKDPVKSIAYLNAEPCPFCGELVALHPNPEWQEKYVVCYHDETCWSNDGKPPFNFNLIPIDALTQWNRRHG